MDNIILAVVEAQAVPGRMFVTVTGIEELIGVAAEIAEAFHFVLDGMAVDDIHDNRQPHFMGGVNELLQIFRRTAAAARGKEGADMVAEAAVIGVLLNRHNLNAVIAVFLYAGQDILGKFLVCTDFFRILCHADMAFIDEQR